MVFIFGMGFFPYFFPFGIVTDLREEYGALFNLSMHAGYIDFSTLIQYLAV
ncbi:hypothetical protein D3C72_2255250 [compost metagenome]